MREKMPADSLAGSWEKPATEAIGEIAKQAGRV